MLSELILQLLADAHLTRLLLFLSHEYLLVVDGVGVVTHLQDQFDLSVQQYL